MATLDPQTITLWLYCAQAVTGIALGVIYTHYFRAYGHAYLNYWALSFMALAIYMAFAAANLSLMGRMPPLSPWRLLLASSSQIAAYLHVALLVLGTLAVGRQLVFPKHHVIIALLGAVGVGLVCALAFVNDPMFSPRRLFARVGVRYLVAGLAFLLMTRMLLYRGAWRRGLGMRTVAIAFGLYGFAQLHAFSVIVWHINQGMPATWGSYFGIVDVLGLAFIGLGLVIWLLEEERDRSGTANQEIERLSLYDAVTGLPNRRQLHERLTEICATSKHLNVSAALLFIEIDRFATLAGLLGMSGRDRMLYEIAKRLDDLMDANRPRPARLEGHRFVVTLPNLLATEEAVLLARRIQDAIANSILVSGKEIKLSATIGIALCPDNAGDPETLIKFAHLAADRAREVSGGGIQFYAPELNRQAQIRLGLEVELRQALMREQFVLEYQPLVRSGDHALIGFEALVRWRRPQHGQEPPAAFLGTVEDLGLLAMLDAWVLDQACRQAALWNNAEQAPVAISVNISAHSFRLPDFPDRVADVLAATGLNPTLLELEITESTALADVELAIVCLNRLKTMGVRASLDDFGTGYSSLSQLRRLPVSKIKIDRSFLIDTHDDKDAAIVAALISLARGLGLTVLVEGIETPEQLRFCEQAGTDLMQGFYFGVPTPPEFCTRFFSSRHVAAVV